MPGQSSSSNRIAVAGACALLSACAGAPDLDAPEVTARAGALTIPAFLSTAPVATIQIAPNPAFVVQSVLGRCLDFGGAPQVNGTAVVLRDCTRGASQQIIVQEINARHDVILHAGSKVLAVHTPDTLAASQAGRVASAPSATVTVSGTSLSAPAMIPLPATVAATATASATTTFTSGPTPALSTTAPGGIDVANLPSATLVYTPPPPPLEPGEQALVLADPPGVVATGDNPVFSFDGDTLMLASNRELVVKVADGRATNYTPLRVGPRRVADNELWSFSAVDGSARRPTTGFVQASAANFAGVVGAATPGTVVELDPNAAVPVSSVIGVPTGVTVRGGRRGLVPGALLFTNGEAGNGLLDVRARDVRITGLRLRGPTASTDENNPGAKGIVAHVSAGNLIIDRNELTQLTTAGVFVQDDLPWAFHICSPDVDRTLNVRVIRNYIHHNETQNSGYGVAVNEASNAYVMGNTFLANRHAIKSGGEAHAQYRAWYNLVLSYAPRQTSYEVFSWYTQDFDVHGLDDGGFGGNGGQYFEIARNTFLATNRQNFDIRGANCTPVDFRDNVSMLELDDAVGCTRCDGGSINVYGLQQFERPNPAGALRVGDFDGDGRPDLFMATGAAWYWSPAGATEWRMLNTRNEEIAGLRFGDFDGDGRTDVFTVRGSDWVVSWGGASGWEVINSAGAPIADLAVGDFVDDKRADVFYADGQTWWVSSGGRAPFKLRDTSSYRVSALRFGDFNGDGKTDIFGLANGDASVTYAGTVNWQPLWPGEAQYVDIANTQVADFNGDGRADMINALRDNPSVVNGQNRWRYYISYTGGGGAGSILTTAAPLTSAAAIGNFDGAPGADILLWNLDAVADAANGLGPSAGSKVEPELFQSLLISSGGSAYWKRFGAGNMR